MIRGYPMKTLWVWLAIGMSGVVGQQQAGVLLPAPEDLTPGSSLARNDPMRPSLRTESDRALELTEVATFALPHGLTVAGAALSPDGARAVVWGSRPRSFLYVERGVGGVRSVPREHLPPGEIAGVAFLDDATLGIIHAEGTVSTVEWGNWTHRTVPPRVIPVSGIRSAALGDDGWWLLVEVTSEDGALHFLPGDGVSSPRHVMPLAASPDQAFLSTAAADALVVFRDSPYPVWRIAVDGKIVAGMQPDRLPPSGAAERDPPPYWMSLSALSIVPGVIQVIADVTSDDRLLVTYDDHGDVLSSRVVQAPFGLVAVASRARVLAALRTFETSEIVLYSWRWRLRAPAGCRSLPERRISHAKSNEFPVPDPRSVVCSGDATGRGRWPEGLQSVRAPGSATGRRRGAAGGAELRATVGGQGSRGMQSRDRHAGQMHAEQSRR